MHNFLVSMKERKIKIPEKKNESGVVIEDSKVIT